MLRRPAAGGGLETIKVSYTAKSLTLRWRLDCLSGYTGSSGYSLLLTDRLVGVAQRCSMEQLEWWGRADPTEGVEEVRRHAST